MNVLVFNVGSTTLKFACIDRDTGRVVENGLVDQIGQKGGQADSHHSAAIAILDQLGTHQVQAIGHRIVQGGNLFHAPTLVTDEVLQRLARLDPLAPLHNPAARRLVERLAELPIPQTLVFDTAYFATLSPQAYRYAVPEKWYREHDVRRYGFHGTSHQYVTQQAINFLTQNGIRKQADGIRLISLHLGGGASATASVGGVAVDTSMGMTPLQGLVMATRCGDIDPAIVSHIAARENLSAQEVNTALNKHSGLMGLCGECDMRRVLERVDQGDADAQLAIEIYVRKIVKTVGSFFAILGGLDALVFTAGVGEHASAIRGRVADALPHLGVTIDHTANQSNESGIRDLSKSDEIVRTLVVPTNEELAIANQVIV